MHRRSTLVPHCQAPKAMKQAKCTFDDPARTAEPAAMLGPAAAHGPASGELRLDSALPESLAMRLRVVRAVALDGTRLPRRSAAAAAERRNRIDQGQELGDVVAIGGGQRRDERDPVCVGENMMLRPGLAAIGRVRSSFFPPRNARSDELSTTARARSSSPRRRSSVSSTACRRFQTPARCHRTNRRQHVVPEPQLISRGSMFQGTPLAQHEQDAR